MRKFLFWSHLVIGLSAGIVIFIMSGTGVLLTYEKQMIEWDESSYRVLTENNKQELTIDKVLNIVRKKHPEEHHFYIRKVNEEGRAIPVWAGHQRYLISPYSGEILQVGESWLDESFDWITNLHRWLAMEGKEKTIAKAITAYSNILFLFIIMSGIFIWFPRRFTWLSIKSKILFKSKVKNAYAKHYNWHHVFGFWAIVPLFVIVCTATVFHFHWANEVLYGAFGEQAPEPRKKREPTELISGKQSYQALFNKAKQHAEDNGAEDWYSMWLEFGREIDNTRFYIDRSIGNDYAAAYALYLNNNSGDVVRIKRSIDWSRGDQAWGVVRHLHTGEYLGFIGQTIAGLSSLAACFLVYTGFSLSWRRFITPYIRKRYSGVKN